VRLTIPCIILCVFFQTVAAAQQRPLLTEDPRLIPLGALDLETGIGYGKDEVFTISGLQGSHVALLPTALHFGLGDRAEFQIGGVVRDFLKTPDGDWHHDVGDLWLATKIKILGESGRTPFISFRPAVVLPNANQASGLGLNTNRFYASVLAGKTVGKLFVFGNIGVGILDDPVRVAQQNDVLTGGVAAMFPVSSHVRVVCEFSGVKNPRESPSPGSESRGQVRGGLQLEAKGVRWDVGVFGGLTRVDPTLGITAGLTKRFVLWGK
jgi:hypothetical protein